MSHRILFAVMAVFLSAGVFSGEKPPPVFVDSVSQTPPAPPADMAQVIVVEPINKIQGLFPVGIFEVQDGKRSLIGTTGSRTRQVLHLAPGRHLLMATQGGGVGHFLEANVEAGKRYYLLLRFIYAQGMQLRPIRTTGTSPYRTGTKDFAKWLSITRFVDRTPAADAHFTQFSESVDKAQAAGLAAWEAKTPEERAELTLLVEDAVSE